MNPEWHCSFQLDGCQGIGLSNYRRHRSADTQWTDLPLPPLWQLAAEQSLQAKASLLRAFLPHLPPGGQQEMEVRWKSQTLLATRGSESKIFCWILAKNHKTIFSKNFRVYVTGHWCWYWRKSSTTGGR